MRIEFKTKKQMLVCGTHLDSLDGKPKFEFLGVKFTSHKLPRVFKEWTTVSDPRCRCAVDQKHLYEQKPGITSECGGHTPPEFNLYS